MILRSVSALEFLQLFVGYFSESKVEVYAFEESPEENIRCRIVENLEAIEHIRFENVLCSCIVFISVFVHIVSLLFVAIKKAIRIFSFSNRLK